MKYRDFLPKIRDLPYFKPQTLAVFEGNQRTLQNEITLWQKQGKVHALRRGLYTLNDGERKAPLPAFLISNIVYIPSYVSLESALSYWGLIPEAVKQVSAVTVRKTANFKNFYGHFSYRTLKKEYFFGFQTIRMEDFLVLMALPEKAILDKIYLDSAFKPEADYFLENLRLQNFEDLVLGRLLTFARRFGYSNVLAGAKILAGLIKKERR